ncbi:DUF302 domain-containing protein [Albimonas pacifica]|uniref:Uncharacterized conserved protein, DUF302 family n=1 Tax=Albimonas pacifica TaxID=1114924 RepID=A0A1I3H1N1_9RHOB|nr:DUF302 domain-containing protein [Albimonas pacifica]SFI29634.1 Uncharacterized conserved protein, DUF302 family [Albimonas pacifica]
MRPLIVALALLAPPAAAAPERVEPRPGLRVIETAIPYAELLPRLRAAIAAEGMGLVTEAGPTEAAAARGETIPGDRVLGVFRNDFAVRALRACLPAMIEAPVRFHLVETPQGASLSWKTPGAVFAAYADDCGPGIAGIGAELDPIFEAIAARAVAP